ncbi:MAG: hypothetical protein ACON4U_03480 [Myxococcota bacterium]
MSSFHIDCPIRVVGYACLSPSGNNILGEPKTGAVTGLKLRSHIPDRKSVKLMTRSVQLGVAATSIAVGSFSNWSQYRPERRGFFVGAAPQLGDPSDLQAAISAAHDNGVFSVRQFGEHAMGLIHPLWLVRGLSNNVLGFASAFFDMQGVNMNYCNGADGGYTALSEGIFALLENRADVVVAGGADSLIGGEAVAGASCSEGAAFVVMIKDPNAKSFKLSKSDLKPYVDGLGMLGAATWPIAFVRQLIAKANN